MLTRQGVGAGRAASSVARMGDQARDETPQERADRNWNELLQELRVSQTGVQVLAGFLVTLPFQSRFDELDAFQRAWYVGLLALAFATVAVMLAPVAIHRRVFRSDAKPELVQAGHRLTSVALVMIAVLMGGIFFLVVVSGFVVVGRLHGHAEQSLIGPAGRVGCTDLDDIGAEIGVDLHDLLNRLLKVLAQKPFASRIEEKLA